MAATAFTKFDPFAFLENRESAATLATLAARHPDSQEFEAAGPGERAAVIKHDDRAPRAGNRETQEESKANARRPYERMLTALYLRCPDFAEEHRWQEATADATAFVSQRGAQAAALGWTPRELFGLASIPDRPSPNYRRLSRYDQTGLVWFVARPPGCRTHQR